jgi:hypothetical protein
MLVLCTSSRWSFQGERAEAWNPFAKSGNRPRSHLPGKCSPLVKLNLPSGGLQPGHGHLLLQGAPTCLEIRAVANRAVKKGSLA